MSKESSKTRNGIALDDSDESEASVESYSKQINDIHENISDVDGVSARDEESIDSGSDDDSDEDENSVESDVDGVSARDEESIDSGSDDDSDEDENSVESDVDGVSARDEESIDSGSDDDSDEDENSVESDVDGVSARDEESIDSGSDDDSDEDENSVESDVDGVSARDVDGDNEDENSVESDVDGVSDEDEKSLDSDGNDDPDEDEDLMDSHVDNSSSRERSVDRLSTSTASTLDMKLVNGIMEEQNYASDDEDSIHEESICAEDRNEDSMSPSSTNKTGGSKRDLSLLFQTRDERIEPYDIAKAKLIKHLGLIKHKCNKGSPKLVYIKQSLEKFKNFDDIEKQYKVCEDYFVDEDEQGFRKLLEREGWVGPWEPNKDEMQDWGKIVRKICVLEDLDWQDRECRAGQTYLTVKEGLKGIHFKDLKKKYKENVDYFTDDKSLQAFVTKKYNWKGKESFEEGGKRKRKELVDLKNNEKDVEENEHPGEENLRKKTKRIGNEKAKGNNLSKEGKNSSNGTKHQRSMRGKVSKQNQRVNKKSRRTKHNPPSSMTTKLSKRKTGGLKDGKKSKASEYKGVQLCSRSQKFVSIIGYKSKQFYLGKFKLQTDAAMCHDLAVPFLQSECRRTYCKNFANKKKYETARKKELQTAYDKCEEQTDYKSFKSRFPRPTFPDEAFLREKFGLNKTEEKTKEPDEFARVTTRLQSKMAAKRREDSTAVAENHPSTEQDQANNEMSAVEVSPTYNRTTNENQDHLVLKKPLMEILQIQPNENQHITDEIEQEIEEYCKILQKEKKCWNEKYLETFPDLSPKELEEKIDFMPSLQKAMVRKWVKDFREASEED
ncbi:predicted protein [Chaetoceros tenuissimus]|uniref:AP2/ERF domain-containing protein n=1 Tax=Chaetoceros tenuissimus TaxID=426638 RepID=A0AAD3DBL9_9STRA|nr:predicted protein [Chaetoceros tenuissimus]